MRHRKGLRKLNRATPDRLALIKTLAKELFTYKKIKTTFIRAKEAQKFSERLISIAKAGNLSSIRKITSELRNDKDTARKIIDIAKERYLNRSGGYTRITRLGRRRGDSTEMALLELV